MTSAHLSKLISQITKQVMACTRNIWFLQGTSLRLVISRAVSLEGGDHPAYTIQNVHFTFLYSLCLGLFFQKIFYIVMLDVHTCAQADTFSTTVISFQPKTRPFQLSWNRTSQYKIQQKSNKWFLSCYYMLTDRCWKANTDIFLNTGHSCRADVFSKCRNLKSFAAWRTAVC